MYTKISFKEHSNYFKNSPIFNELKEYALPFFEHEPNKNIIYLSIQLFMESVIKHNLNINMLSSHVEQLCLLSEDNSKEVLKIFGKIMWKPKDKRTTEDFNILRTQGMVGNRLALFCYNITEQQKDTKERDVCEEIKQEFFDFTLESNQNKTKKM